MASVYQRGDISASSPKFHEQTEGSLRAGRRGRRLGRISLYKFFVGILFLASTFSICMVVFGLKVLVPGDKEGDISSLTEAKVNLSQSDISSLTEAKVKLSQSDIPSLAEAKVKPSDIGSFVKKKKPPKHPPCDVAFMKSIEHILEPKDYLNFTQFSLNYIINEEIPLMGSSYQPRFGGHQTLEERETSFYAKDQTLHCGFVQGPKGSASSGYDLDEKDKTFMKSCVIAVSSCIFGSSDFLRRPTSRLISDYSKRNVCFVMFLDEQTLKKLSSEGHVPDNEGYIGLWRIVIVRNFPYGDMRKTGKVPKFLAHRLFPASRYSIWLDSKMRLNSDPLMILEYFLWRTRSEYAISNHYDRHCVWEEVLRNKRLNKYNHTAIDEQFAFYQSDGLTKFDSSDPNSPLPSYVPEGSFIIRAHTPMSNLFSCLWFNEVDRFTSRDQLSFAYTYLKLRRMNPDKHFYLNMFKDCERRALVKLFHHREVPSPPTTP